MKRQIRYRIMTIPKKMTVELKMTVDTMKSRFAPNGESTNELNGDVYTGLSLFPLVCLVITRQADYDENGQRQRLPYNPNDSLGMTRYQLPIFIGELIRMGESMKVPELYSYVEQRLVVNEELADRHRRVFVIGNMTVEMLPVVITQPDETKVEGIKLKFNNEGSTVPLTLNDLESLMFTLQHLDVDTISLQLHMTYLRAISSPTPNAISAQRGGEIDIRPKDGMLVIPSEAK